MPWALWALAVLVPSAAGQVLLGLSLTLSGPVHEVQKAQVIQQSLELLVTRANEIAFTANGFLDHRGNRLLFGLRVYDDEGKSTKVQQLYRSMIQDRLVDILLGPQTQLLSEAARQVAWTLQRTIVLWSLTTLAADNFPPRANLPGVFSVAVPVENHMQEGLRIARSFGSTQVSVIAGTERHSQLMCDAAISAASAMGFQSSLMKPKSSYELLRLLQRGKQALEVLMTCTSEDEMVKVIIAAERVNISAQVMLSLYSDSPATYSSAGAAVSALLAPTGWHSSQSYPCRAFTNTDTYVQIFQFHYGSPPSADAAAATGAAVAVMAALGRAAIEGTDLDRNVRLTEALHSGGVETMYGPIYFQADGTVNRMAHTVQVEATESGIVKLLLNESNLSNMVWPLTAWDNKLRRQTNCPAGSIFNPYVAGNSSDCLPCPAGWTNAPRGEWCQECYVGTFATQQGSTCSTCPQGADCQSSGTKTPVSLPGYYRLDGSPTALFFASCPPQVCLGGNVCLDSNTGALCMGCLPGTTNKGLVRGDFVCRSCLPTAALVVFLIIYLLSVYAMIAVTAQGTVLGMICKRIINYWQLCSAALHVGPLYRASTILELSADIVLYPFHTLLGPDCLFASDSSNETFVFITGVALLPVVCTISTVFFIIKTGIQIRAQSNRKRGTRMPVKQIITQTLQGATRWNVASLYVLYCPTLIIFMTCFSFENWDVLRLRYFPDVHAADAFWFAFVSGSIAVLQGLAIPTVLWLVLRRMHNRHMMKDQAWQYVFGMLYNDFEPENWFYEVTFFVKRFWLMGVTTIPSETLRIFCFAIITFLHLESLVFWKPFCALDGNILLKLETSFVVSIYCILSAQILLLFSPSGATEVVSLVMVFLAHAAFTVLAIRSLLVALVYKPLTLKALAMPQAMNVLERLVSSDNIPRVFWDSARQRLHFQSLSRRKRSKLLGTLISMLKGYLARSDTFHSSYLSIAVEKSVAHCVKQRRDNLTVDHPRMLAQERRPGFLGCLVYWFPMLPSGSSKEGIALAKQQRIDRRSLNAALPLVSTQNATIDEIQEAFFDYAFHEILTMDSDFYQVKETPAELRFGAPPPKDKARRQLPRTLLQTEQDTYQRLPEPKEAQSVKPQPSEEQLARLPKLQEELLRLREERDQLMTEYEEVQAQIESHTHKDEEGEVLTAL